MAFFPENNIYRNSSSYAVVITLFVAFALWWIFRFLTDVLERNHHVAAGANVGANAGLAPGAVAPPVNAGVGHRRRLHRITTALRDVFLSALFVTIWNYIVNGTTDAFKILLWVTLGLGLIWALARGLLKRLSALLMIPVIIGFVLLAIMAMVNHSYIFPNVED